MAVPGNVLSGRNRGAHALIRDGAKIVEDADDIVEELGLTAVSDASSSAPAKGSGGKTSADGVLAVMEADQAYDLDGLSGASGVAGARLLSRLLDLELRGLIRRVGGGRFMRSM
jgi:DNA processing protein